MFQGNSMRLKLALASGAPFAVDLPLQATLQQTGPPMSGAKVALRIDPQNVIVFPVERQA
jgi:hypothetical protein